MMELTKERLMALSNSDNVGAICSDEIVEMARQLLASMKQEPVACIGRANIDYLESGAGADVWPASAADSDDVLLYAAPQLPQPAVPDEAEMPSGPGVPEYNVGWANGWNSCREEMLQSAEPVSQPNKLRDGWVAVPVEPTPEMNKAGWAAMNEHDAIDPTYRAMLAAAPQQEV